MTAIFNLQKATQAAQKSLGLPGLGVQVRQGKSQIVNVTYDKSGKSTVKALTEWFPVAETVTQLEALSARGVQ